MLVQKSLTVDSRGREIRDISSEVQGIVADSGITDGLCNIFCHHTSASLILCENADPAVLADLENFMRRLVPENHGDYRHSAEGPDDMPAHIRTILSHTSLSIPVRQGRCDLGTWQGIYLWEHRERGHRRRLTVTTSGAQA
jgi:secondary thiamine-phosphate synthase enzyme